MAGDLNDAAAAAAAAEEEAYRKAQIEFVSNNDGTTPRETVLLIMPCIIGLYMALTTSILIKKYLNTLTRYIYEFIIIVLPSILCFTSYIDEKLKFCLTMMGISSINFFLIVVTKCSNKKSIKSNKQSTKSSSSSIERTMCPALTNFRGITNLLTAICILAVDFKVFPRRLGKTEIYGYSLMDTGVGFFILSNALVSREARAVDEFRESDLTKLFEKSFKNFLHTLRDCLPLFALGLGRYLSIELMNYQRHVTEYGIHWNFFATLAFVKIFTNIVSSLVKPRFSLIIGITIIFIYEYFLNSTSFGSWIFHGTRDDFLSANREGIASTIGYVGLYFVGVAIGRLVHTTHSRDVNKKPRFDIIRIKLFGGRIIEAQYTATMILCVKLSVITAQACVATRILETYFGVSRKFANAGYCAWMITLTAILVTLLILLDVLADILKQLSSYEETKTNTDGISSTPQILTALNYNGLAFFLTCNFLTGIINIAVKTLYVDDFSAIFIITIYMIVATGFFLVLYKHNIRLKL